MTDETREKIAKILDESCECDACRSTATDAILAIPEIKEGQELLEKADKLVELDDNQAWPTDPYHPIEQYRLDGYIAYAKSAGFRRVKVRG